MTSSFVPLRKKGIFRIWMATVLIGLTFHNSLLAQTFRQPNKRSPKELSQFQFLSGDFRVKGKSYTPDGYVDYDARWQGYYILKGFVFVDEFSIIGDDGSIYFLGVTYRSYNTDKKIWEMRFYDSLTNEFLDDFSGKFENGEMHMTASRVDPEGKPFISKLRFYDIQQDGFKWKSDRSYDNGSTWIKNFGMIEAVRKK